MPNGYTGKILRVNLTEGSMRTEEYDDDWYRTYYGGRGFNAYFLLTEVGPEVDAARPREQADLLDGAAHRRPVRRAAGAAASARSRR